MFEESGDFDGALREKASAPRIPARRRRGQNQSEDTSEAQDEGAGGATPAVKKNAGWSDEAPAAPSGAVGSGRRAGGVAEGDAPTAAIEVSSVPVAEKFEDLLEIPDLEESDLSDQPSVAEPGFVETLALPTDLSLDEGALPPVQVKRINP